MVGKGYAIFCIIPLTDPLAADGGIGEYVVDLNRRDGVEAMVGAAGICCQIDHSGQGSDEPHLFAVRLRIHIAHKNTGGFREEGRLPELRCDLPDAKDPGGMSLVV